MDFLAVLTLPTIIYLIVIWIEAIMIIVLTSRALRDKEIIDHLVEVKTKIDNHDKKLHNHTKFMKGLNGRRKEDFVEEPRNRKIDTYSEKVNQKQFSRFDDYETESESDDYEKI